jgi:putative membrane protein
MRDLMASLQYVDDFLIYLGLALALLAVFVWVYDRITPYRELELIRNGNTAAAIAYAGAIIGLALPLASAVAHSVNPVDMVIWGVLALAVQVLVYFLVRRLVPQLNDSISENKAAPAVLLAAISVAVGILNAACLTY